MRKCLEIKIFGRVQGVFFRHSAKSKAENLNIFGLARNEDDGSLYIEAEGEENRLKIFLNWCRLGPENAEVEKITFKYADKMTGYKEFKIK